MRKILWLGIRGGVALLLGAVMAVLTGSATLGIMVTGLVMLVVSIVWEAYANRRTAAYGNHSRRSGRVADGVPPYAGAADLGPEAGDGCGGGFDGGGGDGGGGGGL